jgi:DNA repair exonuclease SbcCD ATPase subunit
VIKTINMQNFLSYQEAELNIQPGQLNVVIGRSNSDYADSNGTGKTTLLKALVWGLYGSFPGQEGADDVVNTGAKKNTRVSVEFTKNNIEYRIERYRKHKEHKNNVYLYENGNIVSGDSKTTQAKITNAIGLPYDIFLSTLVFTGEKDTEFASGTDKEQKQILNSLIPVSLNIAYEKANTKYKELQEHRAKLERQTIVLNTKLESAKTDLEQYPLRTAAWYKEKEERIAEYKDKYAKLTSLIEEIIKEVKTAKQELDAFKGDVSEEEKRLESVRIKIDNLTHKKNEAETTIRHYDQTLSQIESTKTRRNDNIQQYETKYKQLTEELEALSEARAHQCPTCGQDIKDKALERTQNTIKKSIEELTTQHSHTVNKIDQELEELEQKLESLDSKDHVELALDRYTHEIKDKRDEAESLKTKINQHKETERKLRTAYDEIRAKHHRANLDLENTAEQLHKTRQEEPNYTTVMHDLEQILKTCMSEMESHNAECKQVDKDMMVWEEVKKMYSGSKDSLHHFMFEQLLPELTATAQMFLNFFSSNTLTVAFQSYKVKGKKTIEGFFVEASRGNVRGFGNLSRGEQRRINVAIALTLYLTAAKHAFNPGILFLDEIADSLDQTGKQNIVEVLQHFSSQYDTSCILLTNERELMAHVHSGYECVMDNDISTLKFISES